MSTVKSSSANLTLNADGSGNDVIIQSNGSTKAIVTAEGTVGIGTSSPAHPLQVGGTVRGTASIVGVDGASPYLKFDHTPTTGGRAYSIYSGGVATGNFDIYDNTAAAGRFSIDSSGNVEVTAGNLVIGTAGKGIDFSAQTATSATGATTTSEILDSYEEGTWTPVVTGSSGAPSSVTYNTNPSGIYTKVGRTVTISFYMHINTITGGSGSFRITGAPFGAIAGNEAGIGAVQLYMVDESSKTDPVLYIDANAYIVVFVSSGTDGALGDNSWGNAGIDAFASGSAVNGSITYQTT